MRPQVIEDKPIQCETPAELTEFRAPGGIVITLTDGEGAVDHAVPLYVRSFLYRLTRGWYLINRTHSPADNPANGWLKRQLDESGASAGKEVSIHQRVYHLDGSTGHFTYSIKYAGG